MDHQGKVVVHPPYPLRGGGRAGPGCAAVVAGVVGGAASTLGLGGRRLAGCRVSCGCTKRGTYGGGFVGVRRPGDRPVCGVEEVGVRTGAADDARLGSVCGRWAGVARTLRACPGRTYSSSSARRPGLCSGPVGSVALSGIGGRGLFSNGARSVFNTLFKTKCFAFQNSPRLQMPNRADDRAPLPLLGWATSPTGPADDQQGHTEAAAAARHPSHSEQTDPRRPSSAAPVRTPTSSTRQTGRSPGRRTPTNPSPVGASFRAFARDGHPAKPAPPRPSVEAAPPTTRTPEDLRRDRTAPGTPGGRRRRRWPPGS